ncbi:hypothetical protein Tco_1577854 [Tanacetum coccineum]
MASLTLEGSHEEEDRQIEFCLLQPSDQTEKGELTVPVYFERGGSCVPNLWDREILLHDALAAFRTRGEKKKKKDALLYLVIYEAFVVAAGSQPSSLAPSIQALMVDASMGLQCYSSANGSHQIMVSEATAETMILDLNVDGGEIHNDNDDMLDSSLLENPEDHQTSAPK